MDFIYFACPMEHHFIGLFLFEILRGIKKATFHSKEVKSGVYTEGVFSERN
jgi:hypothetical protein